MSQKNETLILIVTFIITSSILGAGYLFFTRNKDLNLSDISLNNPPNNQNNSSTSQSNNSSQNKSVSNFPFPETVARGTIINIDGSTSMVQINQALKISFQQAFPGTIVITSSQGSDKGINNLIAGNIDIAAISRPLTPSEKQKGLVAVPISQDAIAIVVGINNPFRRGLNKNQIREIFQGNITNWSQVNGENATIRVINRPKISGTRQIFAELVLNGGKFGNMVNFTTMERDATTPILRALGTDGISYATYAQVASQRTIRTVAIDGLTPEAPNYPYQRTLYYAYKDPANPAVKAFLGYVTAPQTKPIIDEAKLIIKNNQIATSENKEKKNSFKAKSRSNKNGNS